jgi:phage gp16-like protein
MDALVAQAEALEARKAELGAPTTADKEYLTAEQLKELASAQQIPGRSSMTKEELVATVAPG